MKIIFTDRGQTSRSIALNMESLLKVIIPLAEEVTLGKTLIIL